MIRIAFYSAGESWENWEQRLAPHLSSFEFVDLMSEDAIQADIALVWAPPTGRLATLPNLRGIIMQGQGVDHMMADASVPRDIPLVRLVDPDMSVALSHWAILAALDFWRDGPYYRAQQAKKYGHQNPTQSSRRRCWGDGCRCDWISDCGAVCCTWFSCQRLGTNSDVSLMRCRCTLAWMSWKIFLKIFRF